MSGVPALQCPEMDLIEARDPQSGEAVPLFSPRKDPWAAHFRWSPSDPCIIEPLTAQGRATAALLDLNSSARVTIGRWLSAVGVHPPE